MTAQPLALALEPARQSHANGDHRAVVGWLAPALEAPGADAASPAANEAHLLLAHAHFSLATFEDAVRHARSALKGCRALGDAAGECRALRLMSFALTEAALHEQALLFARLAFDVAEANGLVHEGLQLLVLVGAIHSRLGEPDVAESMLLQAVSRAREHPDPALLGQALTALISTLLRTHEAAEAAGDAARAAAASQRLGVQVTRLLRLTTDETNTLRRAVNLGNAGEALGRCGREAEASDALRESLRISREQGYGIVEIASRLRLGQLRLRQGELDGAAEAAEALAVLLQRTPHPEAAADLLDLQAGLARALGDAAAAQAHADAAARSRAARRQAAQALRETIGLGADAALAARVHEMEQRVAG